MAAAFLVLWLAGPASAGGTVFECRAADGLTRLTNTACRPGETVVMEKTLPTRGPAAPAPSAAAETAPGAASADSLRWTVRNSLKVLGWTKEGGWRVLRPTSDSERATVRRAVEEFNRLKGLRLKLEYAEDGSEEALLKRNGQPEGDIGVGWYEDAPAGGLPPPHMYRGKSYVTLGSAKMRKAEDLPAAAPPGAPPKQASAGGQVWLIEFSDRIRGLYKCKADGPVYVTLHELGHALGLGHATPAPSIMHGTCGTSYYPNDLAAFRYAFGD
jgi:hypothetical protein